MNRDCACCGKSFVVSDIPRVGARQKFCSEKCRTAKNRENTRKSVARNYLKRKSVLEESEVVRDLQNRIRTITLQNFLKLSPELRAALEVILSAR